MLKTFCLSFVPMLEALAAELPPVRVEALALAEALRKYAATEPEVSVGPGGGPIDPG